MVRHRIAFLLVSALCLAPILSAETLTFQLDPKATTIEFTFGATLHTVDGTLRAKEGTIHIDPDSGTASGRIVLDATSARTGNDRRDRKMHEKILESQRFPEMVFEVERLSGKLNPLGQSEIELHGTLEMHGTRRPIALPATVFSSDGKTASGTGTLILSYLDWGLADPSFFILRVEKEVRVTVKAVGRISTQKNGNTD
ncbi:MAG TPA: YceI family protein [Thermoanaerobaculia bacterium]|nr:YceI family protein [Thermoanaerobaculia bacterium]